MRSSLFIILFFVGMTVIFSCTSVVYEGREAGLADMADVFWGIDKTVKNTNAAVSENLPRIDTSWYNVREMNGATHPGATRPFGMVSVNASGLKQYLKGYPSGYYKDNFFGFSHFHASGTGTIRWYYNHFLFTPMKDSLRLQSYRQLILQESGTPGHYSCMLNSGIKAEATVGQKSAMHRFVFPETANHHLVVDITHYLKAIDTVRVIPDQFPQAVSIEMISNTAATGRVVMDGLPIYFYLEIDTEPSEAGIILDHEILSGATSLDEQRHIDHAGLYFSYEQQNGRALTTRIGFSLTSEERARKNLEEDFSSWDISIESAKAGEKWEDMLSKFHVRGGDPVKRELFYSAVYKALIKPIIFSEEDPFWGSDNFVSDLATCWDIYVCQLPFVFTFYPESGAKIAAFFLESYDNFGTFPPAYLMKEGLPWVFSKQASTLGNIILTDARNRGVAVKDWPYALEIMEKSINDERGKIFQQGKVLAPSPTHNVDYAYAAFCAATLAEQLGEKDRAAVLMQYAKLWQPVYDSTGILVLTDNMVETDSYPRQHFNFYEGNRWNHSFKVWHDMDGLMALQGGKEEFISNLDWYFNFTPNETVYQFQGLNNEVDYATPFAYLYAGRPDRTQQVVRVAMEYRFNRGRGGLPGNDDSGAMSSWYVWNAIGLFPVVGQKVLLIGSPLFEEVTLHLRDGRFTINAINNSSQNIYVQSARLNGLELNRPFINIDELYNGGELVLEMGPEPSSWGSETPPPSFH